MQKLRNQGKRSSWFAFALSNLAIAAAIGALLRFAFVREIPWLEYRNWMHAHSHVAMLGWVFLALFALIVDTFIPPEKQSTGKYTYLFWTVQLSVWGMLIAFVFRGYWWVSICLLTFHGLLSYIFVFLIWRDLRTIKTLSVRFLRTALVFQVISTLALWAIPVLVANSLRGSEYYYMAIQFFLHFQFNGWFVFTILALFFQVLEERHAEVSGRLANRFFLLLIVSCILTYALAVAWSNPLPVIFIINGAGVSIQFLALIAFCILLMEGRKHIHRALTAIERIFVYSALGCFVLKILMQTAIVVPYIAQVGYTIRNFVIGFMHLILLGVVTLGIFGFAFRRGLLKNAGEPGAIVVLIGFLGVELLLFVQGIMLWAAWGFMRYYYEALFVTSAMILIGVFWMLGSYRVRRIADS